MAYNGSGVFIRLYSWVADAAAGIKIRADRMDNEMTGMATGLSNVICKDGQTTITANLPMAGFKHTGIGNASSRNQYLAYGQAMDGAATYAASVGGTGDVMTLTFSPSFPALVAGMEVTFLATNTNTTNVTVAIDGLTAKAITKYGTTALVAGDITAGDEVKIKYDGTQFQVLSPSRTPVIPNGVIVLSKLAVQAADTFLANATSSSASPTAVALGASQLSGRGSTGDITAITLGTNLSMSGATLNATGGVATVKVQTFVANGTYTPSTGMLYCIVELWGAGGGGGGTTSTGGNAAGGGGAGGKVRKTYAAASVTPSQTITLGGGGTGGANTGGTGATGGNTTFGALLTASGGVGGTGDTAANGGQPGGLGGAGADEGNTTQGMPGSQSTSGGAVEFSGNGGSTEVGAGGKGFRYTTDTVGSAGVGYGAGGGGSASNGTAHIGGAGAPGYMRITEFCSV